MLRRDKIAALIFLGGAALLFTLAFRPELRPRSDFALFCMLSVILLIAGLYHIASASDRAGRFAQQLQGASPIRRLWVPAHFYTSTRLLWELRIGGCMMIVGAAAAAYAAFLAYSRGS